MKKNPDYILVTIFSVIILLGLFVLASVSALKSQELFGHPYYFFFQQILLGFIPGILLVILLFNTPISFLKKWSPVIMLLTLVLTLMVFVPQMGTFMRGSRRWIDFGFISFQPSELLKLSFILYLASWLATKQKKKKKKKKEEVLLKTFLPFIIISGLIGIIFYFQPDISTLGVVMMVALFMYFTADTPIWHTLSLISIGSGLLIFLIKYSDYRLARVQGMLNPNIDPLGATYQISQALIAVGSGGILGAGFGTSYQKFGFLPFPMTDSIFAIFAEESGFIGSFILVILFLLLFWRGILIAKRSNDNFVKLVAVGITSWFFVQAFINIGAMTGLMPLTGIPLPLISYGKSHLITEMAGVGILLNISRYGKKV